MFYQLPPAGNTVRMHDDVPAGSFLQDFFRPYTARYFASGTAALAAAIITAIRLKGAAYPEVILPAYGCPDLVSAALLAGARPVLVDLERERPWMNLDSLAARINGRTVAVVAVNLFGIRERLAQLQELASDASALLIEDSAQAFPANTSAPSWESDLVVISFGRGKPVSLLGGGAILYKNGEYGELCPESNPATVYTSQQWIKFRVKATLYNWLLSPHIYWVPQGLPFLHLGETRFLPLKAINSMDPVCVSLLAANIKAYRSRGNRLQRCISEMISGLGRDGNAIVDLSKACGVSEEQRLLRYPLLLDADYRDTIYRSLRSKGLGPSIMYQTALTGIAGLEKHLGDAGKFPAADDFARRILTVPLHDKVRAVDIEQMRGCLLSQGA